MLRLIWRLFLLLLGVLVIVPPGLIALQFKRFDINAKIAQLYFSYGAWVMRLKVRKIGQPAAGRPLLLASNHISYLDIFALSSTAPLIFTPKAEIANWPLVGFLCRLMGCVFIDRRTSKAKENIDVMDKALARQIPVVLFPEGSTSDSKRILPLRSSMFQVVEARAEGLPPVHVQPVFLSYRSVHKLPMDVDTRHKIAWYGDMSLLPHMKQLTQLGPIEVEVHFLPEIDISICKSRKDIAMQLQSIMQQKRESSY